MSAGFQRASVLGRVPPSSKGLQVNFCKNTQCENYGIPDKPGKLAKGRRPKGTPKPRYVLTGKDKQIPYLKCTACNRKFPIKSNAAIQEEFKRISGYLDDIRKLSCPNSWCANSKIEVSAGTEYYYVHSSGRGQAKRYKCRACNRTFSASKATYKQKDTHNNKQVFKDLVLQTALNDICEDNEISPTSLYLKIDFFYRRCKEFMGMRERRLINGFPLKRIELSIDQQQIRVNWSHRDDRRNTFLFALGAADNISGYQFPMVVNFDPRYQVDTIDNYADRVGDLFKPYPFRKYARLWLTEDYIDSVVRNEINKNPNKKISIVKRIKIMTEVASRLIDSDAADVHDKSTKLPDKGMQVHSQYTIFAYFQLLRELFQHTEKIRIYMDQDAGLEGACLSLFQPEIASGRCDAFFVQINKNFKNPEKLNLINESKKLIKEFQADYPHLTEREIALVIIRSRIKQMVTLGRRKWLFFPFPTMYEPEKAVSHLTPTPGDYDPSNMDHIARLYNRASMHGIDTFFDMTRFRLSPLRRTNISSSNTGQTYAGYGIYKPGLITKLLTILRFHRNYVFLSRKYKKVKSGKPSIPPDKKTPAMRLGLAEGPIRFADLFSGRVFSDDPSTIKKSKLEQHSVHVKRMKGTIKPIPDVKIKHDVIMPSAKLYKVDRWDGETVFVDLETTGLSEKMDKVVEIAIVSESGEVLMNTLVNPERKIPREVAAITHKITDDMVKSMPTFSDIEPDIINIFSGKRVVSYGISFEFKFFTEAIKKEIEASECCLRRFQVYHKNFIGRGSYRERAKINDNKLISAAKFVGHKWNGDAHRALADAMACRDVWLFLDKQETKADENRT